MERLRDAKKGSAMFHTMLEHRCSIFPYFHLTSTVLTVNLPHKAPVTKNSNTIVVEDEELHKGKDLRKRFRLSTLQEIHDLPTNTEVN